jgi:glycosyltransferase involved in cell wall biosynthesis
MITPEPVRLCYLITTFAVGGAENHLLSLVSQLPKERFEVTVAFFKEEAIEARSLVPDFQALGVKLVDLGMSRRWDVQALRRLVRLLREGRYHLLHTHLFRADLLGALARRWAKVPYLCSTVHNTDPFYTHPLWRRLARWAAGEANRVIVISDAIGRFMANQVGIDPGRLIRIHYGLKVSTDKPSLRAAIRSEFGIDPETPVAGIIARLTPQKSHKVLLEAFALVKAKLPESHLIIVGHDPDGLRPSLEALVDQLGLTNSVDFLGYRDDREALIEAMDCFVLPSRWEGFGLVLLEAMTLGRPVVATRVGAIPEIVVDGTTGLLVETDSRAALADALVRTLGDRAFAQRLGTQGHKRVLCDFAPEKMLASTVECYDRILGSC